MEQIDVVSLTKEFLAYNTINPPGNEAALAKSIARLLSKSGFHVTLIPYEENRLHLIAEKGLSDRSHPIILSGHFDTVPLGEKPWKTDPFSGEIIGDKIYGRGSSDMKSGLAAMSIAAIEASENCSPEGGIRLIYSAGEELGCQGISQLVRTDTDLGKARAIIIGEPTANMPATGHKGALYLNARAKGKTAHSSMPELGENAIYKAAKCITKIESFQFDAAKDELLGYPTINVGKMQGGLNLNSVPDHAEFTIDVRSTTRIRHSEVLDRLKKEFGENVVLETLVDLNPVCTNEDDPFVQMVFNVCKTDREKTSWNKALPFMTDGSVLQSYYQGVPTVILGPGEPGMAHQTDEYCSIEKLRKSVSIYKSIISHPFEKTP